MEGRVEDGEYYGEDQPYTGPVDPEYAELTRKTVADIRALQDAGLWEAFGRAWDANPSPETEEAFVRAASLAGPPGARTGYRRASDTAWDAARADYLAGETAEAVCERYGMGVSTFRARARDEGWRRSDQPDPAPVDPLDMAAEIETGLPDYADMARQALVRLNRAVQAGRAVEAARWMRLHARLLDLAPRPDTAPPPAPPPRPEKTPDVVDRAVAQAEEIERIARDALALAPDDLAGRAAIHARVAALEDVAPALNSDDLHHSDGVFPTAESETVPP